MAILEDALLSLAQQGNTEGLDANTVASLLKQEAEAFRQKPATDFSTEEPFAAANRVVMGAKARGSNTTVGIDASGRTIITGSSESVKVPTSSANITAPSSSYETILADMRRISSIEDLDDMKNEVALMKGKAGAEIATMTESLSRTADGIFRVQELEESLDQAIQLDRAELNSNPTLFAKYAGTDSPATAAIRSSLLNARTAARAKTTELMNQSPELAAIGNMVDTFVALESSFIQSMLGKEGKAEMQASLDIAKAGTNAIQVAKIFDPKLDTDAKAAAYALNNRGDKVFAALADNLDNPPALMDIVLTTDSGKARDVVASVHSTRKAGGNASLAAIEKQQALTDLNNLRTLTSTDEGRRKLLESYYAGKPDTMKADMDALSNRLLLAPRADTPAIEKQFYQEKAMEVIGKGKFDDFSKDVSSWNPGIVESMNSSPLLKPVMENLRKSGLAVISMEALAGELAKIPDPALRSNARMELSMYLDRATDYANGGLYGQIGSTASLRSLLDSQIASVVVNSLSSKFMGMANALGEGIRDIGVRPLVAAAAVPGAALRTPMEGGIEEFLRNVGRGATATATDITGAR